MDSPPPVEEQVSAGAVRVEVLDEDGIPIPGVWVRLSGVGVLGALEVSTDADGKARLDHVPPGPVEVTLEKAGFQRQTVGLTVMGGRVTMVPATMRLTATWGCDFGDLPPLLPTRGRRGGSLVDLNLAALPWVALGGVEGVLAHPALGVGEAVPPQILGLAMPEAAVGAVPLALVGRLDAASVGLRDGEGAQIGLANGDPEHLGAALTAAGATDGALGGALTLSGPLRWNQVALLGGAEAGLLGQGLGLVARGQVSDSLGLWGGVFRSDDALLAGGSALLFTGTRSTLHMAGLGASTEAGPEGRGALEGFWTTPGRSTHRLGARLEGLGSPDTTSALISAKDAWEVAGYTVLPSARVRLGVDEAPRLEASLGLSSGGAMLAGFALAGQRYEGLEALDGGEVRSREALVGGAARLRPITLVASALGAARADALSGEALPGRADLQLSASGEVWPFMGVGALTWRPPWTDLNVDLPELETGLLLSTSDLQVGRVNPSAGLGGRLELEEGALTAAAAARVELAWEGDHLRGALAIEGSGGPDTAERLWLSASVSGSR